MGFFDNYEDVGGGNFVGKREKAELANSGDSFLVSSVAYREKGNFGPEYVLSVELDGEERTLSFAAESVQSRDRMLDAMIEYFRNKDESEPVRVVLVKAGKSYVIHDADASVE